MKDTQCKLEYTMFLRLKKDKIFFGPGPCILLQYIKETKSINKAAKRMNMTYTKAIKLIKLAEKELGYSLLEKQIGGVNGGGSILTEEGEIFLNKYVEFRKEATEAVDKIFDKHYN